MTRGFLALWRQPDGTFGPTRRRSATEGREDLVFSASAGPESPVTEAARAQIVETLSRAVTEWAGQHEPLLAAAEERRRALLRGEIAELEGKLAVWREELAARERGEW